MTTMFFTINNIELRNHIYMKNGKEKSIYTMMEQLACITKTFLLEGDYQRAAKCFLIGERILLYGSTISNKAVKNVYIYSLALLLDVQKEMRIKVLPMMPKHLKEEYEHLHYTSGI